MKCSFRGARRDRGGHAGELLQLALPVLTLLLLPSLVHAGQPTAAADDVLRKHGAWVDRAQALQSTLTEGFWTQRALCLEGQQRAAPSAMEERLARRAQENANNLANAWAQLESILDELERLRSAPAGQSKAIVDQRATLAGVISALLLLEQKQAALEADSLASQMLDEFLVRSILVDANRRNACREVRRIWEEQLRTKSSHAPAYAARTVIQRQHRREGLERQAARSTVFANNTSGFPSALGDVTGMAEQAGGTDGISLSLMSAHGGAEHDAVGTQLVAAVRIPLDKQGPFSNRMLFRIQVPLERTRLDGVDVSAGVRSGPLSRRYALSLGLDLSDGGAHRRSQYEECLDAADSLAPVPHQSEQSRPAERSERYAALHVRCNDLAKNAVGLTLLVNVQSQSQSQSQDDVGLRLHAAALGVGLSSAPWAGQFVFRAYPGRILIKDFAVALHLDTGLLGAGAISFERPIRLGLDLTLTARMQQSNVRHLVFLAPSMLLRVTPNVFGSFSVGYLGSAERSGLVVNLGLTMSADSFATNQPPPLR
ncbi:hypothetical protein P2318_27125 [Myxococcaceae bacterium GXIMD 01537]